MEAQLLEQATAQRLRSSCTCWDLHLGEEDGIETDVGPKELGLPYSRGAQAERQG